VKIVTWNINSIRQRLARVLAMLERHEPDVVCLQETKVEDADFPTMEIGAAGYEFATLGQRGYNGVAILSKVGLENVRSSFEGDPVPEQSRVLVARAGDIDVVCVYVVNGKAVGDPAYETKLAWLDALHAWIAATYAPSSPLLVAGDFNVTPDDRDVWDPVLWAGQNRSVSAYTRCSIGDSSTWAGSSPVTSRVRSRSGTTRPARSTRGGACASTSP
jgi:exodeoxyribonuclease-3